MSENEVRMGQRFLIDTNILIYYLNGILPAQSEEKIDAIFDDSLNISVISKIEFLGWYGFSEKDYHKAELLVSASNILLLTDDVAEIAIQLRKQNNIKLADAIIAATALSHEMILVTRDEKDFMKIDSLKIYNPFRNKD